MGNNRSSPGELRPIGCQPSSFGKMPSIGQRARGWCFTINNYNAATERHLQGLKCRYLVFGREVGESGTPHLQGYVYFKDQRSLSAAKVAIGGTGHLSIRKGTHKQAADYCKKDGDFFEKGELPCDLDEIQRRGGDANAAKWKAIVEHSRMGDIDWVEQHHPKELALYKPRLESLYAPTTSPLDGELLHEWWVGPTGSGKSKALWDLYPDHFAKSINKWWDGYRHERIVAIEEWSPDNQVTANALKRWADRYPFTGEVKGGTMQRLRPLKIIVLSNYTLEQCFTRSEDLAPLQRRFKVINFPDGLQHAKFRAAWVNNPPEPSVNEEESESSASTMDIDDPPLPVLDLDYLFSQE